VPGKSAIVAKALLIRTEDQQDGKRDAGHGHAGVNQVDERDDRGHQPADNSTSPFRFRLRTAFDIAHDPGNERAGFVGIVERDRKPADVRLQPGGAVRQSFFARIWRALGSV